MTPPNDRIEALEACAKAAARHFADPGDPARAYDLAEALGDLVAMRDCEAEPPEECALVWRFDDAPEDLRDLSQNGGDEDWLAVVPRSFLEAGNADWMEQPALGCCTVEQHQHPSDPDFVVRIGSHA